MKKSLSPIFVTLVIVIALALGTLYFMVRYRAGEAQWAAESRAMQAQRDQAMQSGRRGMRSRDGGMRPGDAARLGGAQAAPDAESQPETP